MSMASNTGVEAFCAGSGTVASFSSVSVDTAGCLSFVVRDVGREIFRPGFALLDFDLGCESTFMFGAAQLAFCKRWAHSSPENCCFIHDADACCLAASSLEEAKLICSSMFVLLAERPRIGEVRDRLRRCPFPLLGANKSALNLSPQSSAENFRFRFSWLLLLPPLLAV